MSFEYNHRINIKSLKWKTTNTGCYEIISHIPCSDGYVHVRRNTKGIQLLAHRYIWEIIYGPIPPGLCVLHSCDNRKCINPEHLFLGTNQDNTQDMDLKGRRGIGNQKLTIKDVKFIRDHYRRMNNQSNAPALAIKFGVCKRTIKRIANYQRRNNI